MCFADGDLSETVARHLIVEGRVQGVGFRYHAVREAERCRVVGWVRNRADGTVEMWVQGEARDVDALIQWCRRGPAAADVTGLTVCDREIDITAQTFEIV